MQVSKYDLTSCNSTFQTFVGDSRGASMLTSLVWQSEMGRKKKKVFLYKCKASVIKRITVQQVWDMPTCPITTIDDFLTILRSIKSLRRFFKYEELGLTFFITFGQKRRKKKASSKPSDRSSIFRGRH